jgi:RNA polymerase sigma-70 factor (ECF subfamily)
LSQRELVWSEWIIAAKAGDAAAYDRLLRDLARALRPIIRRGLARAGRSESDAEDIVQETLMAIHLKRHTYDTTRPIGPWISAIARHKLTDALRRRGGRFDVPIEDVAESLASEETAPQLSERELNRSLDSLPSGQRMVLQAIAIEGSSIGEAATKLEMTQGAVRVALHRALAALSRRAG